jgi:PAS domain S-box-containing protein
MRFLLVVTQSFQAMARRRWSIPLLGAGPLLAAYFSGGEVTADVLYGGASLAALIALWFGPRRMGAERIRPWSLLATGQLFFLIGDISSSFPGIWTDVSDVVYLAAYPFLIAGVVTMAERGRHALGAATDAALVIASGGLFVFLFLLEPLARQKGESGLTHAASYAYPLLDLLLLAVVVRLLLLTRVKAPAYRLFTAGVVVLLVTDLAYASAEAHGAYSTSSWLNAGWLTSYALWCAAAIHPSAATGLNARVSKRDYNSGWVALIGVTLLAPTVAAAIEFAVAGHAESGDLTVFGGLVSLLAIVRLTQLARERERSHRHFRSLIENASDMILIVDADQAATIRYASPSVERHRGFDAAQLEGRSALDLIRQQDRRAAAVAVASAAAGDPAAPEVEVQITDAAGVARSFLFTLRRMGSGPHAGAILINCHDVTARRAAEAELASKNEQLRQSQKMEAIGQLAGGVAHDFNNLLTAIRGFGELALAAGERSRSNSVQIRQMLHATDLAASLTTQLLAFSRRQILQPRPLELQTLLGQAEQLLVRLIGDHIDLHTRLTDEPVWVAADPTQIDQVILNVAINARDAMPDGGTLTIELRTVDNAAELVISDTGTGMDATTRARAAEPFFTTKEAGKGTGLGLSTVYGIVAQSGGDISLASAPEHGTTVTIVLPRIDPPPEQPAASTAPTRTAEPHETRLPVRALVVEDNEIVRHVIVSTLEQFGYEIVEARDGASALRLLDHDPHLDLLVTDAVMPGLSGPQLASKARLLRPDLAIVLCSGFVADALTDRSVPDSYVFLPKPFGRDELRRAIETALTQATAAAA